MVIVRNSVGEPIPMPYDATFIELCTSDGKLVSVHYNNDVGETVILTPGTQDFKRYCSVFDKQPAKVEELSSV